METSPPTVRLVEGGRAFAGFSEADPHTIVYAVSNIPEAPEKTIRDDNDNPVITSAEELFDILRLHPIYAPDDDSSNYVPDSAPVIETVIPEHHEVRSRRPTVTGTSAADYVKIGANRIDARHNLGSGLLERYVKAEQVIVEEQPARDDIDLANVYAAALTGDYERVKMLVSAMDLPITKVACVLGSMLFRYNDLDEQALFKLDLQQQSDAAVDEEVFSEFIGNAGQIVGTLAYHLGFEIDEDYLADCTQKSSRWPDATPAESTNVLVDAPLNPWPPLRTNVPVTPELAGVESSGVAEPEQPKRSFVYRHERDEPGAATELYCQYLGLTLAISRYHQIYHVEKPDKDCLSPQQIIAKMYNDCPRLRDPKISSFKQFEESYRRNSDRFLREINACLRDPEIKEEFMIIKYFGDFMKDLYRWGLEDLKNEEPNNKEDMP